MKTYCSTALVLWLAHGIAGCSSDSPSDGTDKTTDDSTETGTGTESASGTSTGSGEDTSSGFDTNTQHDPCEPPDLLIVFDRTLSMQRQPNGDQTPTEQPELSKWYLAIDAVEKISQKFEEQVRFGLELFPRNPADGSCVTLAELLGGKKATNPKCEPGELLVPVAVNAASEIAAALDPSATLLCISTPIGSALDTAMSHLASVQNPIRKQYILILTDGRDTCDSPDPVERTQALKSAGIASFVVGFDGSGKGIDPATLNNMACAAQTAPDFKKNCVDQGGGNYVAADPEGPALFISATDGADLQTKLDAIAALIGCTPV